MEDTIEIVKTEIVAIEQQISACHEIICGLQKNCLNRRLHISQEWWKVLPPIGPATDAQIHQIHDLSCPPIPVVPEALPDSHTDPSEETMNWVIGLIFDNLDDPNNTFGPFKEWLALVGRKRTLLANLKKDQEWQIRVQQELITLQSIVIPYRSLWDLGYISLRDKVKLMSQEEKNSYGGTLHRKHMIYYNR